MKVHVYFLNTECDRLKSNCMHLIFVIFFFKNMFTYTMAVSFPGYSAKRLLLDANSNIYWNN